MSNWKDPKWALGLTEPSKKQLKEFSEGVMLCLDDEVRSQLDVGFFGITNVEHIAAMKNACALSFSSWKAPSAASTTAKTLAVVMMLNDGSRYALPAEVLRLRADEDVRCYDKYLHEKELEEKRRNDIALKIRDVTLSRARGLDIARRLMTDVLLYARRYEEARKHISTDLSLEQARHSVDELLKHYEVTMAGDGTLIVTLRDLMLTQRKESPNSFLHRRLDGVAFPIGTWQIKIAPVESLVLDCLPCQGWAIDLRRLDHENIKHIGSGYYAHPHVKADAAVPMGDLSVCWGTYDEALHRLLTNGDLLGAVRLVEDFLTSCSEGGWYQPSTYFMPDEMRKGFCRCGHTHAEDEQQCRTCGTFPDGVTAADEEDDDEEDDDEEDDDDNDGDDAMDGLAPIDPLTRRVIFNTVSTPGGFDVTDHR